LLVIGYWIAAGFSIHELATIYFFWFMWGYLWFRIADEAQLMYAGDALIEDPQLFERAVASNYIMIARRKSVNT
jgi:hypothetical protein